MKTEESVLPFLTTTINKALKGCEEGKVNEALKILYRVPFRECVPWAKFPAWARPTDPVEGCHEG